MAKLYEVRFWNKANECIMVGGKYSHAFESFEDAWDSANAMLKNAVKRGAVSMDINNDFYPILDD